MAQLDSRTGHGTVIPVLSCNRSIVEMIYSCALVADTPLKHDLLSMHVANSDLGMQFQVRTFHT